MHQLLLSNSPYKDVFHYKKPVPLNGAGFLRLALLPEWYMNRKNMERRGRDSMDLESSRLIMEPISLEEGQMLIKNPMTFYFQKAIPYEIAWPSYGLKAFLPIYVEKLSKNPEELGFGPWFIKDKHNGGFLIGNAGFSGRPDVDGAIELGYELLDKHNGHNYTGEVIDTLCQWAFYQEVKIIRARCTNKDIPSQKLLKQNGFKKISQERGLLLFERRKVQVENHLSSI